MDSKFGLPDVDASKLAGDIGFTDGEIIEAKNKIAAGASLCTTLGALIIRKAAATGTCLAGKAALAGLFSLAEGAFAPEGEVVLVPLEVIVIREWSKVCDDIGIELLGQQADKWAATWCSMIGLG